MLVGMSPKPSIFTKGRLPMANRTRPNQILFFVSDDEKRIIQAKMAQLGTKNMGAYLRKMAIDGYIIKVDYTQQKKLAAAVSRAATNINHVCRRINSTGHFYEDDVAELKERQKEIWQLLKSSQSEEL
jgi:alpha/beta superfamily hydrolase